MRMIRSISWARASERLRTAYIAPATIVLVLSIVVAVPAVAQTANPPPAASIDNSTSTDSPATADTDSPSTNADPAYAPVQSLPLDGRFATRPDATAPDSGDVQTSQAAAADKAIGHSLLPHNLSPWGMFLAADIVVKAVMIGLAVASFLVWTIWLGKLVQLWLADRRLRAELDLIRGQASLDTGLSPLTRRHSLARAMLEAATRELKTVASLARTSVHDRIQSRLGEIEAQANRSIRGGMSFLATVGATAPFIGLFGTVWGIMNSFIGISESQTTNLAVVAPGIAEALLATAIGLVAAIPAVILYNQLSHGIAAFKRLTRETKGEVGRILSRQIEHQLHDRPAVKLSTAAE